MTRITRNSGSFYADVTKTIVEQLKSGTLPWVRKCDPASPADPHSLPLRFNGKPYCSMNILLLWIRAAEKNFDSPYWMTAQQAAKFGGQVRKGEEGSPLLRVGISQNEASRAGSEKEDDETVRTGDRRGSFSQQPLVFNADQIQGLPARFFPGWTWYADPSWKIATMFDFVHPVRIDIRHSSSWPYYDIDHDIVQMPDLDEVESISDKENFCHMLARECVHWTRCPSRLDRSFGKNRGDDEAYAMEELVGEIGAAFLMADLGLPVEPLPALASHLASLLEKLRHDPRAMLLAADHAQKALDFLRAKHKEGKAMVLDNALPCKEYSRYAPPVSTKVLAASAVLHEVCTPLGRRARHDLLCETVSSIVAKVIVTAPDGQAETSAEWVYRVLENPALKRTCGMMSNLPVETESRPASEPLVRTLLFIANPELAIVAILRLFPGPLRDRMLTRVIRAYFGKPTTWRNEDKDVCSDHWGWAPGPDYPASVRYKDQPRPCPSAVVQDHRTEESRVAEAAGRSETDHLGGRSSPGLR